jgi:hypothetical protein
MDNDRQRIVPTYVRVWQYPWLVRGIGEYTFWRPIQGRAIVAFGVTIVLEAIVLHRLGVHVELVSGALVYLGGPFLVARGITLAPLRGKRADRWAVDQFNYQVGAKRLDRFRPVAGPAQYEFGSGGDRP